MAAEEASGATTQAANPASTEPDAARAWQPFTPKGVTAFALSSCSRLLLIQFTMAVLAAASLAWFAASNYFPQITEAIKQLPAEGEIRGSQLRWGGDAPRLLAANRFLALVVDLDHSGQTRSPAHILVEFGGRDALFISLFGSVSVPYPDGVVISFNQPELNPWWGAWAPPILAMIVLGSIAGLMLTWALLALLYCGPICLLAFFSNRECGFGNGWRLAGAALMPGAAVLAAVIVVFGLGGMNLIELLVAWALHFLIGWVYMGLGIFHLPRLTGVTGKGNPFGT